MLREKIAIKPYEAWQLAGKNIIMHTSFGGGAQEMLTIRNPLVA